VFESIVGALLLAWFLTWFEFEKIFIGAFNEMFNLSITTNTYYFVFFIAGAVIGIINILKMN